LWKAKHCILLFASASIAFRAVSLPFPDLPLVVSAVYSVHAKIGYRSLLKDDVSGVSKIGYSQKIGFGHLDLQCKCSLITRVSEFYI